MSATTVRTCATCHEPVGEFRDDKSRGEFGISGMCQTCQDDFFCDLEKPGVTECHKPCCEDESEGIYETLLAALKTARVTIEALHGEAGWDIYEKHSPEMLQIDAAIAKAEGSDELTMEAEAKASR